MMSILSFGAGLVRLAAMLLALAAMGLSLLALGGVVSRWLDVLTHFAPFYLAAGAIAVAARLLTGIEGARPTVTMGLAAVAFAAVLMAPEMIASLLRQPAPAAGQTLKVVQFNLWGENFDPAGTAQWIVGQHADVVVLEETFDGAGHIPGMLKAEYPYQTSCAAPAPCSTMILTRDKPSAFGGLHGSVSPTRLAGAWVTLGDGPTAFTVFGAHYTWPVPPGPQQAQSVRLAEAMESFDKSSIVVAGDFNSTPWSFALWRQDARFGLERRTRALFSWPAARFTRWDLRSPLPFLAIDHVYAGSQWKTVSVARGPRLGSDHFPVVVVLRR